MPWIEPVTNRVAGSRTTATDMNRICNNLTYKGFTLSKSVYTRNDIVNKSDWEEIVSCAKRGDFTVTDSTHYKNLNKLEAAIEYAEPMTPLRFEAYIEDVNIKFDNSYWGGPSVAPTIEYSFNNTNWNAYTLGTDIHLAVGEVCYFRGNNSVFSEGDDAYIRFKSDTFVKAKGNVMSLLDTTMEQDYVPDYAFCGLFRGAEWIVTAPDLPATTIGKGSYSSMFGGCVELLRAPDLPATTLSDNCYENMFGSCEQLEKVTSLLPAARVPDYAYRQMFIRCKALTTAPSIAAEDMLNHSCELMFCKCYDLVTVPKLPSTSGLSSAYEQMFMDCSSLQVYSSPNETCKERWKISYTGYCFDMFKNTQGDYTDVEDIRLPLTVYTQNEPI